MEGNGQHNYARNEKGREDVLVPITFEKVKNVKD